MGHEVLTVAIKLKPELQIYSVEISIQFISEIFKMTQKQITLDMFLIRPFVQKLRCPAEEIIETDFINTTF